MTVETKIICDRCGAFLCPYQAQSEDPRSYYRSRGWVMMEETKYGITKRRHFCCEECRTSYIKRTEYRSKLHDNSDPAKPNYDETHNVGLKESMAPIGLPCNLQKDGIYHSCTECDQSAGCEMYMTWARRYQ